MVKSFSILLALVVGMAFGGMTFVQTFDLSSEAASFQGTLPQTSDDKGDDKGDK